MAVQIFIVISGFVICNVISGAPRKLAGLHHAALLPHLSRALLLVHGAAVFTRLVRPLLMVPLAHNAARSWPSLRGIPCRLLPRMPLCEIGRRPSVKPPRPSWVRPGA